MAINPSYPCVSMLLLTMTACAAFSQSPIYPKEIRGYKVEKAAVELKKTRKTDPKVQTPSDVATALIQFGNPRVARVTPLGISLEMPIVVSPVRPKRTNRFPRL